MDNIVTIKVLGILTLVFSVQALNAFVVADTFPILVLGNRTLGGFGGVSVDEVTAGHLREDEALPFPLPAAVLVCLPAEVLLPLPCGYHW